MVNLFVGLVTAPKVFKVSKINLSVSQRACLLATTHSGKVRWWLNDKEKGVLLRGVDTRTDLWAMVDLYGKCNRIQITNTCQQRDYTQSSQQPGAVPLVNQGQVWTHIFFLFLPFSW